MAVHAKTEYAKFRNQFQEGIHPAMKKLYKQASGARNLTDLGDLSIEGQDPDPPEAAEGEEEGGAGSDFVAEGAATPEAAGLPEGA